MVISNQLTLNVKKSNFIVFKSRNKKLKKELNIKLNNKTLELLFKLQKKILRIITFSPYNTPSLPLFNKLEILNIHQINDLLIFSFSYNLVNNALPPYFNNFCIINAELHNYYTRSSRKPHKTFNKTNYSVYSTRNKGN